VLTLYRVFPWVQTAAPGQPGHPLFIPSQGAGRLDNPELYSVLYLSDSAPGAVAEAFGRFPEWIPAMLEGSPALPGSRRALARYHLAAKASLCDLDDPLQLRRLDLRPSQVVSRDYTRTRAWARQIYESGRWAGIRWWSYYDPQWASIGLWNIPSVTLADLHPLSLHDDAIVEASRIIVRRIITKPLS
jgi:hypothetical protein